MRAVGNYVGRRSCGEWWIAALRRHESVKNDCGAGKEHKMKQYSHDTERMALRNMEHGRWTEQSAQLKEGNSRLSHRLRDSLSTENGGRERN